VVNSNLMFVSDLEMNFLSVTGTMSYIDYYHTHILYFKWYFIRKQTHLFTNNVSICIWHRHRAITSGIVVATGYGTCVYSVFNYPAIFVWIIERLIETNH